MGKTGVALMTVYAAKFIEEQSPSLDRRGSRVKAVIAWDIWLSTGLGRLQGCESRPCKETEAYAFSARHSPIYVRDLFMAAVISPTVGRMGIPLGTGCMNISTSPVYLISRRASTIRR